MSQPIAIQSWCFRHFKALPDFFRELKNAGVSATELCGVHTNFNDTSVYKPTIDAFKAANVKIVAIGVQYLTGDIEKDRPNFEFCKAAGVKNMSISFPPTAMFDGLKNIEKLAEEYDLKLGIHNHGGNDWLGNDVILEHVFKNTKSIGLHMDTAWAIDARQNPVVWAEKFADRMVGIHIKDFLYTPQREPQDVIIGTGILDLPKLFQTLKKNNFDGPVVIEYEADETNPAPKLKKCVEALQKLM